MTLNMGHICAKFSTFLYCSLVVNISSIEQCNHHTIFFLIFCPFGLTDHVSFISSISPYIERRISSDIMHSPSFSEVLPNTSKIRQNITWYRAEKCLITRVATNLENMDDLESSGTLKTCQNLRKNSAKFEFWWKNPGQNSGKM